MKIQKLSFFTLSFFMLLLCSTKLPKPYKKAKKHNWMYVKDSLLMSAIEMSNGDYQIYLNDLKSQNKLSEYNAALPDTNVWEANDAMLNHQPFVKFYFQHPAYKDYPLVGVTQQQAIDYCQWLTQKINNDPKRVFKKVEIRLPTTAEWRNAAKASDPNKIYPWKGLYVRNSKGLFLANFKVIGDENLVLDSSGSIVLGKCSTVVKSTTNGNTEVIYNSYHDCINGYGSFITTPVFSYWPNEFGLYNMAGNVSELVAEKNQYIGGDWFSIAQFLRINNPTRTLEKPNSTVGFRPLMQVQEY